MRGCGGASRSVVGGWAARATDDALAGSGIRGDATVRREVLSGGEAAV